MKYILFDDDTRYKLFPLTLTRPVADLRVGITTIREKWEHFLGDKTSSITADYLQLKFPLDSGDDNILINGAILPHEDLIREINKLGSGEKLFTGTRLIALRLNKTELTKCMDRAESAEASDVGQVLTKWDGRSVNATYQVENIERPWDIFTMNGDAIEQDMEWITANRKSAKISDTNKVMGNRLFVENGAKVEHAILNTETGPIYIGKDTEIMEGSMIRGPFALCDHAGVKMGAKIYGATTIGPYCKVGGEVNNSVLTGYSNKGHDGFLGNSVIGEWCNLGADTNNSNLKNNYGQVKAWSYHENTFVDTGLQFCGLIMGDHSKSGINTMFNTGTVVGVSCNIFGGDFPRNFIPSFSWGGAKGWQEFNRNKAIEVATRMMQRRGVEFGRGDESIFDGILAISGKRRVKSL